MPDKVPAVFVIIHSTLSGSEPCAWAYDYDICDRWIDKKNAADPAQPGTIRIHSYNILEVPHIDAASKR